MKDPSSDDIPSKRTTREPDIAAKVPELRNTNDPDHTVTDTSAMSKNKRPSKTVKKRRKAGSRASTATIEPMRVTCTDTQSAVVATESMSQPVGESDKQADLAPCIGSAVTFPGGHPPSVALSPTTAPNEGAGGTRAYSYSFGSPIQQATASQSASCALSDRVASGGASTSATIVNAAGSQAKYADSRPSNALAAGIEKPEPVGPGAGAMSSLANDRPAGAGCAGTGSHGGSAALSPQGSAPPGKRDYHGFSLSASPEAVVSPKARIGAILRFASPSTTMSADLKSSPSSGPVKASPDADPALSSRRPLTRRKDFSKRMSMAAQSFKSLEETEAIEKLRELSLRKPNEVAAAPDKARRYWTIIAFLVILFLALVAVGLIGYGMQRGRSRSTQNGTRFCRSSACIDHADTIGLSDIANDQHESSPCEDFGSFICSVWKKRHDRRNVRRRITWSALDDAMTDLALGMDQLVGQGHVFNISERPRRMMDACFMDRPSDDTEALDQLLGFMRSTGFGFPAENVSEHDYSQPLKALTELAYHWTLPLWFYVDFIPEGATNRTITISLSALSDLYATINEALNEYEDVYAWYVDTLVGTVYRGSIGQSFHKFARASKTVQNSIFGNLSKLVRARYHDPVLLRIKRLPHFVTGTTVDHWLEAFKSLRNIDPPISEEDTVYFRDRSLLLSINALFTSYKARVIYLHVHWWLVQVLGVLASNAMFHGLRKDPERGETAQKILCAVQVTANYNAIFSGERRARLASSQRQEIMARLANVHAVAVSKVSSAMGARFALLLELMKPVIWLPEPYASEAYLLRLYGNETKGNETTQEDNFIQLWLSRATSYQQSSTFLDGRSFEALLFRTDSTVLATHHVLSRTVSLSLALLEAPFYYRDATSAIFYSGIGFVYVVELIRALNSISLLLDGRDTIEPSSSSFSQDYVWAPYTCSGMVITEIYPQYMALEIAYAAYRQYRNDAEDVPLWNAQGYTPEQVFFATICYLQCDITDGADTCKMYMKHFPEFSKAFSCPPKFAMEPCDILD
ncbi:hypothetical protein HPB50_013726 [Hyalomma asiaticum]|uniref:Uncharacterized protein n=1 Tax=Hyalomma asiaticum TaxID=266040 RepID=A0ACB7SED0_HYAAI|nr:hypothetical protein HPB50_013726 [Hyalomma asiaticum]